MHRIQKFKKNDYNSGNAKTKHFLNQSAVYTSVGVEWRNNFNVHFMLMATFEVTEVTNIFIAIFNHF